MDARHIWELYLGSQCLIHLENVIWGYCVSHRPSALCLDEISQRGEVSSASTGLLRGSPNIVVDLHTIHMQKTVTQLPGQVPEAHF